MPISNKTFVVSLFAVQIAMKVVSARMQENNVHASEDDREFLSHLVNAEAELSALVNG